MKKITISDVAEYAGVSKSTVSQFLNKRYEYMGVETRSKIEQAVDALNYRPNLMARSLKQKTSFTIGLIVANIIHSFSTKIINALEVEFDKKGFQIIVCNSDDNPLKEKKHVETLLEKQVDGLIIFPTGENEKLYENLKKQKEAIVFIDRYIENINIPCILLDNEFAIKKAVEVMSSSPLAIVTTSLTLPITPRIERLEGFRNTLKKQKVIVDERYIKNGEPDEMSTIFDDLMKLEERPKGIIAANDRIAQELMKYVKKNDIKVPEELQIIIIDEVPYAEFITPSLTTLEQPAIEMANKAAQLLLKQITNNDVQFEKKLYRYEPILNKRQSTL